MATPNREDFIYLLHQTVATNGGKIPFSQLAEKYKELHGTELRVDRFIRVKGGRVFLEALRRIPHVVLVREEAGNTMVSCAQKLDIPKDSLLKIDQKIRDTEDFIWCLHTTIVANGGKIHLSQLADKYKEQHGTEFRIEKILVVKDNEVEQTLRRLPHVVQVTEDSNDFIISCSQAFDITKDDLLRIDQKIRDRTATMRAQKRALEAGNDDASAEKRAKEANQKGKPKAPPKPQPPGTAAHGSKAAPPPPSKGKGPVKEEKAASKDDAVVLHAILRLLEQKGPLSLSSLNESFQARWKCPFRPGALGVADNDLEKYFRESKHFRLLPGPEGPILSLKTPASSEIPTVLDQISNVRQQVAVLGIKLEELQASLEREKIKTEEN